MFLIDQGKSSTAERNLDEQYEIISLTSTIQRKDESVERRQANTKLMCPDLHNYNFCSDKLDFSLPLWKWGPFSDEIAFEDVLPNFPVSILEDWVAKSNNRGG